MIDIMRNNPVALMISIVFVFAIYLAGLKVFRISCVDPIMVNTVLSGLEHRVKEAESNSNQMMNLYFKFALP